MAKARQERRTGTRTGVDLEAIGLVVLAAGIFLAGVLLPALPSGELGRTVRAALVGRVGWGAYAAPLPPLVLGGLFLLRRNPRWWPRVALGYALLAAGAWGLLVFVAPAEAGAWGASLRTLLTGAWGVLAVVPAAILITIGVDVLAAKPPTHLLRVTLAAVVRALRATGAWLAATRKRLRARAAFRADAAQARRALADLDRDLQALSALYPGSGELERWREEVRASQKRLASPTSEGIREARADLRAWQGAVQGFAKDRAAELVVHLEAESALSPDPDVDSFESWGVGMKRMLGDAIVQRGRAAEAADRVRKALALDVTSLLERHRRLTRERDTDRRSLKGMTPRQLVEASKAHQRRLAEFAAVASDAEALDRHGEALEPWRGLIERLAVALEEFPEHEELADYHRTLAAELDDKKSGLLAQYVGWSDALEAVMARAAVEREARAALRAREEREAAREAAVWGEEGGDVTSDASGAAAGRSARDDGLPWLEDDEVPGHEGRIGIRHDGGGDDRNERRVAQALIGEEVSDTLPAGTQTQDATGPSGQSVPNSSATTLGGAGAVMAKAGSNKVDAHDAGSLGAGSSSAGSSGAGSSGTGSSKVGVPKAGASGPGAAGDTAAVPEYGAIPIQIPPVDLLDEPEAPALDSGELAREHRARVRQIDETLANFKLGGRVVAAVRGPTVTRFEVEPAPGEKISRFSNLSDDLALAMAAASVRIEAPIPGKSVIGLEVPNANRELVRFREAAESASFRRTKARLPIILGKSIDGEMVVGDLARMPHLLIAGSTGSGKSVAVNTLVGSLLYRFLPTELRFLMIDPKMVELTPFDGAPHLLRPVVTNPQDAAGVLLGAVAHMERRYKMMSKLGAKNLDQYNEKAKNLDLPPLPFIVIVIDELADLMVTSAKEVESAIMRLAQMARATGMHLILATQRPSVDILTSLIKVNVPARMAFAVSSSHDSRTILDSMGAERLIGMGDMLFYQPGLVKAVRLQGPFVSENEIARVSAFLRRQYYDDDFVEAYGADFDPPAAHDAEGGGLIDWNDDKLRVAAELVINEGQASVSRLQRRLQVGHARAGKLMDSLEALGVVGAHQGSKPREVLVELGELPNIFGK